MSDDLPMSDGLAGLDDDALVRRVGAAVDLLDPPPPSLFTFAHAALDWGRDRELLEGGLVESDEVMAGMRAVEDDGPKHFQYRYGDSELYVTIDPTRNALAATGSLVPPVREVTLILASGDESTIDCDEFGRFEFSSAGRFSLGFDTSDGRSVRTDLIG